MALVSKATKGQSVAASVVVELGVEIGRIEAQAVATGRRAGGTRPVVAVRTAIVQSAGGIIVVAATEKAKRRHFRNNFITKSSVENFYFLAS